MPKPRIHHPWNLIFFLGSAKIEDAPPPAPPIVPFLYWSSRLRTFYHQTKVCYVEWFVGVGSRGSKEAWMRWTVTYRVIDISGTCEWQPFYDNIFEGWLSYSSHFPRHGNKYPYPWVPAHTHPDLTGFGFGFSPISKHGYGTGNKVICTHPEPILVPVPNIKITFFLPLFI